MQLFYNCKKVQSIDQNMEYNMTPTFSVGKDTNFYNEILLDKASSCPSSSYVVHYLTLPHVQQKFMIRVYY
jgi:hypothetical protein